MTHAVQMSVVHRPNDTGLDIRAGASAKELVPTDYHPVEMPDPEEAAPAMALATIHRPGDAALDLPAGSTAGSLAPTDYHVVDMDGED